MKIPAIPFLLVSTIAIFGSCSKEKTGGNGSAERIVSFSPIVENVDSNDKANDIANTQANVNPPKNTNFEFISHAWYLPEGKKWDENKAEAKPYIVNERVKGFYGNDRNIWKPKYGTIYYWPRGGTLTFMSYTCMSDDQLTMYEGLFTNTYNGTVSIDKENGLSITEFVNFVNDADLLVADIATDRVADLNGVPTMFRHKLAKLSVYVSKESADDTYSIELIAFNRVYHTASYYRGGYSDDYWTKHGSVNSYNMADYGNVFGNFNVTTEQKKYGGSIFVIPQNLNATPSGMTDKERELPQIKIIYKKNNDTSNTTKILNLNEITSTDEWTMGSHYVYNIIFGNVTKSGAENSCDEIDIISEVTDW